MRRRKIECRAGFGRLDSPQVPLAPRPDPLLVPSPSVPWGSLTPHLQMAQHKAPTQVSIAPLAEKSSFEQFISRYWMPAAAIAIAIGAGIIFSEVTKEKEKAIVAEHWDALRSRVDLLQVGRADLPASSELKALADELEATPAGPWARALEVQSAIEADEFTEAEAAIGQLSGGFVDHPITSRPFEFGDEDNESSDTLPAHLQKIAKAQAAWSAEHERLFGPPELADDAPRVQLNTSYGPIIIGLYPEHAPEHVANFIKLCNKGFYDGTKFHRVVREQLIQGGDPNSKEGETSSWGSGGPGYTIPQELTELWHFRGMLAAARSPLEVQSSGSQFYITSQAQHQYDKQYTVFGRVLEGMEIVDTLASEVGEGSDRPENPAVIDSAQVL